MNLKEGVGEGKERNKEGKRGEEERRIDRDRKDASNIVHSADEYLCNVATNLLSLLHESVKLTDAS